jgi:DmsE family decaheme c-type cytochrome
VNSRGVSFRLPRVLARFGLPPLLLLLGSSLSAQTPPAKSPFVGSTVCKGCHPGITLNFYKNAHFKSIASGTEAPERTGCEGCHGPARAHVEGMGNKSLIRAFSTMPKKQVLETCLTCHSKDMARANIQRSQHTQAEVVCTNCHSVHKAQTPKFLLAKQQAELCYTCHTSVQAQFSMPFKHRVNEGAMQCTDCHNPHGTFAADWRMGARPRLVDQKLGNEEPCLRCHSDKRGPFVFEHAPVRVEGCETCHSPHGSMNAKLLRRPVVFTVCLECHTGAGNGTFGASNGGVVLQSSSHNMLDPKYQKCTTCHVRIHGSNSDPNFLR